MHIKRLAIELPPNIGNLGGRMWAERIAWHYADGIRFIWYLRIVIPNTPRFFGWTDTPGFGDISRNLPSSRRWSKSL
jgi:hypothetical protein